MRRLVLLLTLFLLCGCTKPYPIYSKMEIDQLEPFGMKFDDKYEEIDIDEGFEIYQNAISYMKESKGFQSHSIVKCYDFKENSLVSSYKKSFQVNNYFSDNPSAIVTITYDSLQQETYYEVDKKIFLSREEHKNKIESESIGGSVLENFLPLQISNEYIKHIDYLANDEKIIYKYILEIKEGNKGEFFKYDPIGKVYTVIDDEVQILIELDKNKRITKTMTCYKFDYYGSMNLVKTTMDFSEISPQNLVFPSDIDTWPLLKTNPEYDLNK